MGTDRICGTVMMIVSRMGRNEGYLTCVYDHLSLGKTVWNGVMKEAIEIRQC